MMGTPMVSESTVAVGTTVGAIMGSAVGSGSSVAMGPVVAIAVAVACGTAVASVPVVSVAISPLTCVATAWSVVGVHPVKAIKTTRHPTHNHCLSIMTFLLVAIHGMASH